MNTRGSINLVSIQRLVPYIRVASVGPLLCCLVFCNAEIFGQRLIQNRTNAPLGMSFVNVAPQAGLTAPTIYGDEHRNRYLLETTGTGAAFIDYDNDGWLDIFLVNGTRLDGLPPNLKATNRLYRNGGDGRFIDVTEKAGLARTGWGQSVCIGDYDNNGYDDIFVSG